MRLAPRMSGTRRPPKTPSSAKSGATSTKSSFAATRAKCGAWIRRSWTPRSPPRIPTRTDTDDRYFTDTFQSMPLHGYTKMFEKMLAHPNIKIMLNTDWREVKALMPAREIIFTGPVDEYFDHRFGRLPYRSLEFKHETRDAAEGGQIAATLNYPNDHAHTRTTEMKWITGQTHEKTDITYEYPNRTATRIIPFRVRPRVRCTPATKTSRTRPTASTSPGGSGRTNTTTWIRSSAKRWLCSTS